MTADTEYRSGTRKPSTIWQSTEKPQDCLQRRRWQSPIMLWFKAYRRRRPGRKARSREHSRKMCGTRAGVTGIARSPTTSTRRWRTTDAANSHLNDHAMLYDASYVQRVIKNWQIASSQPCGRAEPNRARNLAIANRSRSASHKSFSGLLGNLQSPRISYSFWDV